jgi:hypothetical protein
VKKVDIDADRGERANLKVELVWWMHPLFPVLFFGVVVALWTYASEPARFGTWGTPRYLDQAAMAVLVLGLSGFIVGITVSSFRSLRNRSVLIVLSTGQVKVLRKVEARMFVVISLAYAAWMTSAIQQGASLSLLQSVVFFERGAVSALKDVAVPLTGVSTFTQLAPVMACVSTILWRIGASNGRWRLGLVVMYSLARSLLYGERLALIEVLVPVVLLLAVLPPEKASASWRRFVRSLPLAGPPVLWVVFASFEYTRSWASKRAEGAEGFVTYVTDRLLGYYGTSVNNSALYYGIAHDRPHVSSYPLQGLWDMPVVGRLLENQIGQPQIAGLPVRDWWFQTVNLNANPEFVNTGTFLVTAGDFGPYGMVFYWIAVGLVIGAFYSGSARGSIASLVAYGCSYIGLLEISRILYYSQGRFIVTLAGVGWLALAIGAERRRRAWKAPRSDVSGAVWVSS